MEELEVFLSCEDNRAICDQMSPKIFRKHKEELLRHIKVWIGSKETDTVRFGAGMLPFPEEKRLDDWTHDMAIRKCVEGRRIPEERKVYLGSLKTVGQGFSEKDIGKKKQV